MEKLIQYLIGVVSAPTKTFEEIAKDKKISLQFLILIAATLSLLAALYSQVLPNLYPQIDTPVSEIDFALKDVLLTFQKLDPLLTLFWWLFLSSIVHRVARVFSKKGSFISLLTVFGLIDIINSASTIIVENLIRYLSLPHVILSIPTIWLIYLTILAISSIYAISKTKALAIFLFEVVIAAVLMFGLAFLYIAG